MTPERLDACAQSEPRAALEYASARLTPERLDACAQSEPWAALEYASALLTPERLDACAQAEPWAALEYASALLTPERFRAVAAPWFADSLVVDDIGGATNWCDDGIREAMGQLGLADDADEYDRAEVHAALKVRREKIYESDRAAVALAILDRVEAMK